MTEPAPQRICPPLLLVLLLQVVVPAIVSVRPPAKSWLALPLMLTLPLANVVPVPLMPPALHVVSPETLTFDEPPNVPPLRVKVAVVAPPVLLNVTPPPLNNMVVVLIACPLLNTPMMPPVDVNVVPTLLTVPVKVVVPPPLENV